MSQSPVQGNPFDRPRRFQRRQFAPERTYAQAIFDAIFGIVLPVTCFALTFFGGGVFEKIGAFPPFFYVAVAPQLVVLALWLAAGRRLGRAGPCIGAILLGGGAIALAIGIFMLPMTLIGMCFAIGFLGLTPFFTAFVYIRNGVRAVRTGFPRRWPRVVLTLLPAVALGIILPAAAEIAVDITINRAMDTVLHGDPGQAQPAIDRLTRLRFFVNAYPFIEEYRTTRDKDRHAYLEKAYAQVTGHNDLMDRAED
jgi:hypothetical protein